MAWISCLLSSSLLVDLVSAAFIQYPLQSDNSAALTRLRDVVGDLLIPAYPVARSCFNDPYTFNETECAAVNKSKSYDQWVSDQPGGYFYGNWASCQSTAESCALPLPDDAKAKVSNTSIVLPGKCHHGNVPDYMVKLNSSSYIRDINATFEYANRTKKPLIIRNTGHDWKGRSAGSGSLAIWTHDLRFPHIKPYLARGFVPLNCTGCFPEDVIHFGGGEIWGNAYQFAEDERVAILGGTCGSVGMAGWLSGGGHSPFTPYLGMGVDNVRQVEIVTPKGEVKIANKHVNSDLFFAVRGGGGGTFGVVTKITYRTVDRFKVRQFSANLTNQSELVRKKFIEYATLAALNWAHQGWGGYIKLGQSLELVKSTGTMKEAKHDMSEMVKFMKSYNIPHYFKTHNSSYQWQKETWGAPEKHIGAWSTAVSSRLLPKGAFSSQNRTKLVQTLVSLENDNLSPWLMLVTPTTFNHTTDSALHPSWKHAIWSVRINTRWDQSKPIYKDPREIRKQFERVHTELQPIRELAPDMGVSIAEADIWEVDHENSFWGKKNHQKLTRIKNQVDPDKLMSNWQAVDFNPKLERFKCYPKL